MAATLTDLTHALPHSFREPVSQNVSQQLGAWDANRALVLSLRSLLC